MVLAGVAATLPSGWLGRCGPVRLSEIELLDTPGAIRTHDLRFRKPSLYPAELREQFAMAGCQGRWQF